MFRNGSDSTLTVTVAVAVCAPCDAVSVYVVVVVGFAVIVPFGFTAPGNGEMDTAVAPSVVHARVATLAGLPRATVDGVAVKDTMRSGVALPTATVTKSDT